MSTPISNVWPTGPVSNLDRTSVWFSIVMSLMLRSRLSCRTQRLPSGWALYGTLPVRFAAATKRLPLPSVPTKPPEVSRTDVFTQTNSVWLRRLMLGENLCSIRLCRAMTSCSV